MFTYFLIQYSLIIITFNAQLLKISAINIVK